MLALQAQMNRAVEETQAATSTTEEAPARAAAAGPIGSPQALLELQATAGNRAVRQLIAARRAGAPPPPEAPRMIARDPPEATLEKETPKEEKSVLKGKASGPTSQKEFAWKKKIGTNKSISFKLTFARTKDTKVLKGSAEGDTFKGALSLWELKSVREKCGGEVAHKIQASLAQAEGTAELLPGLIIKVNAKLLEYQMDRVKKESELNFLTVSGSIEGNITEWANLFAGIPEADRSKIKVTVAGEFKWTPSAGDLARLKDIWKHNDTIRREAKVLAENAKKLEDVEKKRKALDKRLKDARKEADDLRRKANKAKRPALKKRYQKQV
jgi:hypothetical protein